MPFSRCLSGNLKASERKLFLTPLVTYLEDIQSGVDIDRAVNRVLSPLRRKAYLSLIKTYGQEQNGSTSEFIGNCSPQSGHGNLPKDELELDEMSSMGSSFHICITDNRGLSCRPILKDSLIKPARLVKVMLDWTEKGHELYDASYLKDLPELHKAGPTVKKTRQEAISLFSCLDAFLKEEPLGPDDMW